MEFTPRNAPLGSYHLLSTIFSLLHRNASSFVALRAVLQDEILVTPRILVMDSPAPSTPLREGSLFTVHVLFNLNLVQVRESGRRAAPRCAARARAAIPRIAEVPPPRQVKESGRRALIQVLQSGRRAAPRAPGPPSRGVSTGKLGS